MKPVTLFSSTETMYKALRELLTCRPECLRFDDGHWRVVEIPPQAFPPVNKQSVFVLMEYVEVDLWAEGERWLVVGSSGEHPDGYDTLEDALEKINRSPLALLFTHLNKLLDLAMDALGIVQGDEPSIFTLELDDQFAYVTLPRACAVLWDYDRDGRWEVCTHSNIGEGFFEHTLYFNSEQDAREALPSVQMGLSEHDITPLGSEVNDDDGWAVQFQTEEPLDHETQVLMAQRLQSAHVSFDVPSLVSFEDYQLWRSDSILSKGDRVSAGQTGRVGDIINGLYRVEFGNSFWDYDRKQLQKMCPLCPEDYDTIYPLEDDFFGSPCTINGIRCCETCYNVYLLTSDLGQDVPSSDFTYETGQTVEIDDEEHCYDGCGGIVVAIDGEQLTVELAFVADTVVVKPGQLKPYEGEDWRKIENDQHWPERRAIEGNLVERN